MKKIGIDIGGTSTRVGIIENGKILKLEIFDTDISNHENTLNDIFNFIDSNLKQDEIQKIGIACPGPLDLKNGVVLNTPNLTGWNNVPIVDVFQQKYRTASIAFNNDANVAAFGQWIQFDKPDSLLYFTISTGIGAGFVFDGKIFSGSNGKALEIANSFAYDSNGKTHTKSGIEYIASGKNIPIKLKKIVDVKNSKEAFDIYNEGNNKEVHQYFEMMKNKLIEMFSTAIYFYDPSMIVVGGGVALKNKDFFKVIFQKVDEITQDVNSNIKWNFADDNPDHTLIGASEM